MSRDRVGSEKRQTTRESRTWARNHPPSSTSPPPGRRPKRSSIEEPAEPAYSPHSVEREFNPDGIRQLKANTDKNIAIGGAHLALQAFAAGLIDEIQLPVVPVIVGGNGPLG